MTSSMFQLLLQCFFEQHDSFLTLLIYLEANDENFYLRPISKQGKILLLYTTSINSLALEIIRNFMTSNFKGQIRI